MITLLITVYVVVTLLAWLVGMIEMGTDIPGIVLSFGFALVWPFFLLGGIVVVITDIASVIKGKFVK